jgi:transposase
MRRGMQSLALQVQEALKRDPFAGDLYVFRGRSGQAPTFCIQFSLCNDRLSLASTVREKVAGLAVPARQGLDVHLYERTARPLPRAAELDVRREVLRADDERAGRDQYRGSQRACRLSHVALCESESRRTIPSFEEEGVGQCGEADITIERNSFSSWNVKFLKRR